MKKLLFFLVVLTVVGIPSKGQFKSIDLTRDYGLLASSLEPIVPTPALDSIFYFPWMDTIVSLHRELAEFLDINFPLDTTMLVLSKNRKISNEEEILISKIKLIRAFPNEEITSNCFREKEKKKRYYYEKQRLTLIKNTFEKAKADSNINLMASTLELIVFYYQNRILLSTKKSYEEYGEAFVDMRNQFAFVLSNCLARNDCRYQDVSQLFGLSLNAWPNFNLAYGILQRYYSQQWDYLFKLTELRYVPSVTFTNASECFLSLLYLYNVEGKTGVNELVRGFNNLMAIPYTEWQKDEILKVLRIYLAEKQKVYP